MPILDAYGRPYAPAPETPAPAPLPHLAAPAPQTPAPRGTAPKPRPRATRFPNAAPITVNRADNPKAPGTASYERFTLYAGAPTVGAYIAACEAAGFTRQKALADLRWDTERGFITVGA